MEEEKKPQDEKPEIKETEEGGVEVSLDEEKEDMPQVQEGDLEHKEEKPVEKQDSFKNKVYAQERIIAKQQREIDAMNDKIAGLAPKEEEKPPVEDDLDKLAQKDWKQAVKILSKQTTKEMLEIERSKIKKESEAKMVQMEMDKNAEFVTNRHKELGDSSSEKSEIFRGILQQNPRWQTSSDGPLLTMYRMEEELRKRGYDVDGTVTKGVENETNRLMRVNSTSLDTPKVSPAGGKVILTKEQRDFCDVNGIAYNAYARSLQKSAGGGVEL